MWMNHEYLKKKSLDELFSMAEPYLKTFDLKGKSNDWLKQVLEAIWTSINYLSEIPKLVRVFFERSDISADNLNMLKADLSKKVLSALKEVLQKNEIIKENFKELMNEVAKKSGAKGKDLYMPIRIALTGESHGPELILVLPILGSKECISRIGKLF